MVSIHRLNAACHCAFRIHELCFIFSFVTRSVQTDYIVCTRVFKTCQWCRSVVCQLRWWAWHVGHHKTSEWRVETLQHLAGAVCSGGTRPQSGHTQRPAAQTEAMGAVEVWSWNICKDASVADGARTATTCLSQCLHCLRYNGTLIGCCKLLIIAFVYLPLHF